MSLRISVDAVLDDSQAKAQQAELEAKNEKIKEAIDENEKRTKEAFNKALGAMRASYMVVSGVAQAMGGSMAQAFSAIYGVAVAGITTYQSIAAAMASVPGGQLQAILMTASLITAIVSLAGVLTGQEEFAKQISGLNSAIQGIGSLIGVFDFE